MDTIGERLAYTRTKILRMNQKDFSKLLNISQGALSEMENDKRGIPMEAIIELMKYSKSNNLVSCFWILTGMDESSRCDSLSEDEQELLQNYAKLDRRGRHRVHTLIYEEMDRMAKSTD